MKIGRQDDGQSLLDDAVAVREVARRIQQQTAAARACFDPPSSSWPYEETRPRFRCIEHGDRFVVVEAVGSIDFATQHELSAVLARAVNTGVPEVIVDLTAVTLLSAAAIHCLERATFSLSHRGGRLHVVCPPDSIAARVLRIVDPYRWFRNVDVAASIDAVTGRF